MLVQVNTDHTIEGHLELSTQVSSVVKNALRRISDHITRVEVHLTDENGNKNGHTDKRCMMEARIEGRQPIAVTFEAPSVDQAVNGAVHKLARLIEGILGRSHDLAGRRTDPLPEEVKHTKHP